TCGASGGRARGCAGAQAVLPVPARDDGEQRVPDVAQAAEGVVLVVPPAAALARDLLHPLRGAEDGAPGDSPAARAGFYRPVRDRTRFVAPEGESPERAFGGGGALHRDGGAPGEAEAAGPRAR